MSIRSIARALSTLVAAALMLVSARSFAAGEVTLLRAYSSVGYGEGLYDQTTIYQIVVKDLAFDKRVVVHLKQPDGTWSDLAATYVAPAGSGRELWRAEAHYGSVGQRGATRDLEFALEYSVLGATYWDNNGGANYKVAQQSGGYLGAATTVLAADAYAEGSSGGFGGDIDVRNLGYAKRVAVIYTTDNWAHTQVVDAHFVPSYAVGDGSYVTNPNAYGVERWFFNVPGELATLVTFAVVYTINGQTYWDNNFGQNYTASFGGGNGATAR